MFPYSVLVGLTAAISTGSSELTVYNQGFALVKEPREFTLKKGVQQVVVEDVAQTIETSSVGIRSVSSPGSFSVLEQNYKYDLIDSEAILAKAIGKRIAFTRVLPDGSKERFTGILMSAPREVLPNEGSTTYNGMVIKADDGRIILNPTGEIEVSEIPEGMISKPSLVWMLDSKTAGLNKIEVSYLTRGMGWNADYVLALDKEGKMGEIKGWVTLRNNSGTTFEKTKLKLLAGEVHRSDGFQLSTAFVGSPKKDTKKKGSMTEETFSEYHLYSVQHPVTVANNELKQVSLLEASNIPVRKRLVIDTGYRSYQPDEDEAIRGYFKPVVKYVLMNDEASNLGMPFPAGKVKVFQRDSTGSLQMIGEDEIAHTPKKEKITLTAGTTFDIVCEKKRTKFAWINRTSKQGTRETFEIEVRNRKNSAETVEVFERHELEWKVTQKSMVFERPDAETMVFMVNLKPQEVKKITYTVETRW